MTRILAAICAFIFGASRLAAAAVLIVADERPAMEVLAKPVFDFCS